MTTFNSRFLFVVIVVCMFCYGNARRLRSLGDIALAMDIIDQTYVEPADRDKLYKAAMNGMIDSLDRYSSYIPQESLKPFQAVLDQEFGGLGVSLDGPPRRDRLVITSTLFDSPAYRAGIKPGDRIVRIGESEVSRYTVDQASPLLRGKSGTTVHLQLERGDEAEKIEVDVVRALIAVDSVTGDQRRSDGKWNFVMQEDPRIAYLRITLFGEKTVEEMKRAIESTQGQAKGIVLDLRDNSGGLLHTATEICDMFLDDGPIVSTRGRDNRVDEEFTATAGTLVSDDVQIVVLVNENSASASEVLAACLQDRNRATIVGKRSFGKGSVQSVIPLEAGRAALRLTTAYYFPPSGRRIHRRLENPSEAVWGVDPDDGCEVGLENDQIDSVIERFQKRAQPVVESTQIVGAETDTAKIPGEHLDPSIVVDPQLLKAVEVLQSKLSGRQ